MDEDNGKAIYFVSDTLKDQLEELRKLLFKGKWESEEEDDEADDSRFIDEDFIAEGFKDEDK